MLKLHECFMAAVGVASVGLVIVWFGTNTVLDAQETLLHWQWEGSWAMHLDEQIDCLLEESRCGEEI